MLLNDNPESYPEFSSLTKEKQEWVRLVADTIKAHLRQSFDHEYRARAVMTEAGLSMDETLALYCFLESFEKAALKRQNH